MAQHFRFAPAVRYPSTGNICDFVTGVARGWIGRASGIPGLFDQGNVEVPCKVDCKIFAYTKMMAAPEVGAAIIKTV